MRTSRAVRPFPEMRGRLLSQGPSPGAGGWQEVVTDMQLAASGKPGPGPSGHAELIVRGRLAEETKNEKEAVI
ncbi:hypothetical protein GCM10010140_55780 [Streptosporangium pseudovulgare]|uniref:Uncharacterized protein n=1 Tax=Streptosporangium pseudovulgare TaxID=35765 RepID=A0ABQ2RAN4_9ACTN|nr:hypothetical protein GCM10010140_55780 [Streptosporangium pseudovulgare]